MTDTEGQILMKKKDNYARHSLVYLSDNQQLGDEMSLQGPIKKYFGLDKLSEVDQSWFAVDKRTGHSAVITLTS